MDYTTLDRLKAEMHADPTITTDDVLLALLLTSASRAWDRKCTGVLDPDAENYFASGSVVGEVLQGRVDGRGTILSYPHKPIISSVSSYSYQATIVDPSYTVDPSRIDVNGPRIVAYPLNLALWCPSKCRVTISYVGGLASSGSAMPADMQEAVAILATRFYKEAENGLTDAIGIPELATVMYTKAWPIRVTETMWTYKRRMGWRFVS